MGTVGRQRGLLLPAELGGGRLEGGALSGEAVRFEASRKWLVPGGGATGAGRREEFSLETMGQVAQSPGGAGWG